MTQTYTVSITAKLVPEFNEEFGATIDSVASELFKLPGGAGAAFSGNKTQLSFTFGFQISAKDYVSAVVEAVELADAAIVKAGVKVLRRDDNSLAYTLSIGF
jgi:hypothetical protein